MVATEERRLESAKHAREEAAAQATKETKAEKPKTDAPTS